MSVIVRGVEMPKNCALCKFRGAGETWCPFTLQEVPGNTIPEDCPLGPVPPHGDLIDLRTVNLSDGPYEYNDWVEWALEQYQNAPVFILADNPKEEE